MYLVYAPTTWTLIEIKWMHCIQLSCTHGDHHLSEFFWPLDICLVNHWCVKSKSVLTRYTFKPISINDYVIYHTITLSNLEHVLIVNRIPYNETYRSHYQVRLAKTDRLWPTYSALPLYDHVSQFGWQHLWITVPIRCDWKPNTSTRMSQLHFVESDSQCWVYQNMPLHPK